MSFKDQVIADNEAVFMNKDELAEMHDLNGTQCLSVIEGLETKKRTTLSSRNFEGLFGTFTTVHVKKEYLPGVPVQGENFKVNGKLYKIDSCTNEAGMLTIVLGGYSGRG